MGLEYTILLEWTTKILSGPQGTPIESQLAHNVKIHSAVGVNIGNESFEFKKRKIDTNRDCFLLSYNRNHLRKYFFTKS